MGCTLWERGMVKEAVHSGRGEWKNRLYTLGEGSGKIGCTLWERRVEK
jgi:hypothetical protein